MKTLLNILHFGVIGAGIGAAMTLISMLIMGVRNAPMNELIAWLIASFLIGVITLIMYTEKLKLLAATAIHLVLTFITVAVTGIVCGYGNGFLDMLKGMLPLFIIIYVVVYFIIFGISKLNEREINKALNNK